MPSSGSVFTRIPLLNLTGYGIFVECSRLRLWAARQSVEVFDREYAKYGFLDVVSDDENLNGSYASSKDVAKIVYCLNLPEDPFAKLRCHEQNTVTRPKFLFYMRDLLASVVKHHDNQVSWLTSKGVEPNIPHSDFAQLVNGGHKYPHIFTTVPRGSLDEFTSTIASESPLPS